LSPSVKTFSEVRLLHAMFVLTWFFFLFVIQVVRPAERPVGRILLLGIAAAAGGDIALGFALRKRFLDSSLEILRAQPANPEALLRWRTGNILAFCNAETVTLFGVVLKFLGARWMIAGVFFAVGLGLLLLWTPRLLRSAS
jgi:hypothetical protein